MRTLFLAGILALFGLCGPGLRVSRADDQPPVKRTPVCATDTIDHMPAGMTFLATPNIIGRELMRLDREKDPIYGSHYETQDIPVIFDKRITWADGSAIGVTCTLNSSFAHLESRVYTLKGVSVEVKHSSITKPDGTPLTPWRKYTFALDTANAIFPSTLVCEVEATRIDSKHPEAKFEQTSLEIGSLEDLLFEDFPIQMVTENAKCGAIKGNQVIKEAGGLLAPGGSDHPAVGQRHSKGAIQSSEATSALAPGNPAAGAAAVEHSSH